MADSRLAIERTLKHEGGYVNDPDDAGGETNFGITKRDHPSVDVKNLTRDEAIAIYKKDYWIPLWDEIESQPVADCLFDFGVNAGVTRAIECIQRAVGRLVAGPFVVDGVFGIATLGAVNSADQTKLLRGFVLERLLYYAGLNRTKFLRGWFKRALDYWV